MNTMPAGDTIALCRTGAWNVGGGGASISNPNCAPGGAGWPAPNANATTCDFRDYVPSWGSTSSPRPILNVTGSATNFFGGTSQGWRFWNIEVAATAAVSTNGTFLMGAGSGYYDLCNVYWHDGDLAFNDQSNGAGNSAGHFTVRNSDFRRSQEMALLGASNYLVWDSNYFENNGIHTPGVPQYHDLYMQQNCLLPGCIGGQIVNNHSVSSTSLPPGGDLCSGVRFVIHGYQSGLIVKNNLIENSGGANTNCYALQSAISASPGSFVNMVWSRNRVFNMPGTAMDMSCSQNGTISDNIIVNGSINLNDITNATCTQNGGMTVQNNSIYNGALSYGPGGGAAAVYTDNNAFYNSACAAGGDNAAGVITVTAPTTEGRRSNNYCRSVAGAMWVNPTTSAATANFTPLNPGPFIGAANQTFFDTPAVGILTWSATDTGMARTPPSPGVDIGAMQH
jgi:hypothetical protein